MMSDPIVQHVISSADRYANMIRYNRMTLGTSISMFRFPLASIRIASTRAFRTLSYDRYASLAWWQRHGT
jgi:hypothetical protein